MEQLEALDMQVLLGLLNNAPEDRRQCDSAEHCEAVFRTGCAMVLSKLTSVSFADRLRRSASAAVQTPPSQLTLCHLSPAGSVGASAFGRGVHRTPAPLARGGFFTATVTYIVTLVKRFTSIVTQIYSQKMITIMVTNIASSDKGRWISITQ